MRYDSVVLIFLLTSIKALCQPAKLMRCYHQQIQSCNSITNTTTDYTLELFPDSTIRVAEYTSNSADQNSTITRRLYTGAYSFNGDTLNISWLNKSFTTKRKKQRIKDFELEYPRDPMEHYPCNKFVVMKRYLAAANEAYPSLGKVGHYAIRLVESAFDKAEEISQSSR